MATTKTTISELQAGYANQGLELPPSNEESVHAPAEKRVEDAKEQEESLHNEEVEIDEVEAVLQEAIEMGYNPEGVEGKRNISAQEFIDREPFFKEIAALKKQNKQRDKDFEQVNKHLMDIRLRAVEEAKYQLKSEKLEALDLQDNQKVIEIDDRLLDLNKESAVLENEKSAPTNNVEFNDWVMDNNWYNTDVELKAEADMQAQAIDSITPGLPLDVFFKKVGDKVKRLHPDKFKNEKRSTPAPVDASPNAPQHKKTTGKTVRTLGNLDPEQQGFVTTMLRNSVLSEKEYLEQLPEEFFN